MYEKYCDTYYLTQGIGCRTASILILSNPNTIPCFQMESYEVIRKNNLDFIVDEEGGYVSIENLSKYNIMYE